MPTFRGTLACALVSLSAMGLAQSRDQIAAERVLGPQWKQISRAAGSVFAATVVDISNNPPTNRHPIPTIEITSRVTRAIAGVQAGQVFTIREWAGASVLQRPMHSGERMLLLLYSVSPLGLTSPVGGHIGQIELDPSGRFVVGASSAGNERPPRVRSAQSSPAVQPPISVDQLERAIRSARQGRE